MKMKTIMSIIAKAGLPALVILSFTACSWDCPGLPENMPWFIAEDYMYQTVSFTNGRDTVSIEYEGVVFENRSDKDVRSDNYGICELSVHFGQISHADFQARDRADAETDHRRQTFARGHEDA